MSPDDERSGPERAGGSAGPTGPAARPHRSQKPALLVLAVVALLAVGFLAGSLVKLPTSDASLPVPAADSVDVGFAQDMTVHHTQAVQMANVAYTRAESPEIRSLAFDILTSQQAQIGQMQGWLSLWGRALLPTGEYMTWMVGGDGSGHSGMAGMAGMSGADASAVPAGGLAQMPGMATQDELAGLRGATGPALDVLFLQLMLRHHEGGASMLTYAAQNASQPVVANFARQVSSTQLNESEYMTSLLAARGAQPLPPTS